MLLRAAIAAGLVCWSTTVQAQPLGRPPALSAEPLKILFIGTSLTFYNLMPSMLAAMSETPESVRPIRTKEVTDAGRDASYMWSLPYARDAISGERWDYVVLQVVPHMSRGDNPELLSSLATEVSEAIKTSGARTVFYVTWLPREANLPASKNPAALGWRALADQLGALHAAVGSAWEIARAADPTVPLYQPDDWHPSPLGSYLAACVIYRVIQGTRTCPTIDIPNARERELEPLRSAAAALALAKVEK